MRLLVHLRGGRSEFCTEADLRAAAVWGFEMGLLSNGNPDQAGVPVPLLKFRRKFETVYFDPAEGEEVIRLVCEQYQITLEKLVSTEQHHGNGSPDPILWPRAVAFFLLDHFFNWRRDAIGELLQRSYPTVWRGLLLVEERRRSRDCGTEIETLLKKLTEWEEARPQVRDGNMPSLPDQKDFEDSRGTRTAEQCSALRVNPQPRMLFPRPGRGSGSTGAGTSAIPQR